MFVLSAGGESISADGELGRGGYLGLNGIVD
jgi:hypothetical protein